MKKLQNANGNFRVETQKPNRGGGETAFLIFPVRGAKAVGIVGKDRNTRTGTYPYKAYRIGFDGKVIKESFRVFYDVDGGKDAALDYATGGPGPSVSEQYYKNPADKPHPRSAYAHLPLRGMGLEGADPVRKSHLTAAEKKLLGSRPLKFSHDDEQEWKALEQAREDLLRSYRTKYEGPTRSSRPHSESAGADLPMYGIEHGGGTVEQIKRRAERLWKNNPRKTARRVIERRIVKRFVQDAIKAGYRLAVSLERGYDVEEMLLGSVNVSAIMAEAFAGDEAHIFVQPEKGPTVEDGAVVSTGWVYIVFGNEGWDVIADYTTNLESVLAGANKLAESLE